jgi:hypothetical protein
MEGAVQKLGVQPDEPVDITLLPRVLGHGGFARRDLSVSYLDRNYAGQSTLTVLGHEMIHALDNQLGGELRPIFFVEGVAVYLTGGHYKPEPLMPRAAALLSAEPGCAQGIDQACGLGLYIPLDRLIDNFYWEQHEISYLQAGALVEFMVDRWGWAAFSDFYRQISPIPEEGRAKSTYSQAVDRAAQKHFGLSLQQLEALFADSLRSETLTHQNVEDVRLTVVFYDTLRRYQQLLDPSAYFMTAWLPDNVEMRKRSVEADYLRHPEAIENLVVETMLVSADVHLRVGDFVEADRILEAVNLVLDVYPREGVDALSVDPIAAEYRALVGAVVAAGYQPQLIEINDNAARIWAHQLVRASGPQLYELAAFKQGGFWELGLTGN